MIDTQATEAGRLLARARWGTSRLDRAVELLAERRDDLGEAQRAQLREIADGPARDGDGR
jgi:hypothetical protein